MRQGVQSGCQSIPFLAAVTLRDFVALAIRIPPRISGGAAVPRPHVRDEGWSDPTQLRQEGSTGDRVIGTFRVYGV